MEQWKKKNCLLIKELLSSLAAISVLCNFGVVDALTANRAAFDTGRELESILT